MLAPFPPGGTDFLQNKVKSLWREFSFMLHEIQQAIEPIISLNKVLQHWKALAKDLAERSRTRRPQITQYEFK